MVGDVRHQGLDAEARAMTYWPHPRFSYPGMTIAIRTIGDASAVVRAATAVIREQDPNLAVADVRTHGRRRGELGGTAAVDDAADRRCSRSSRSCSPPWGSTA